MKNKESFLKELQNGLAVLAESEQQDILAEYAQHIDMRIAGGLTEEEAIQDFGDIHQLTAEILAAYHVNPAYSRAPGKLPDPRPALSRAWSHTGNFFRRLGHGLAVFFSRAGRAIAAFPHRLAARFRILFRRPNVMQQESEECIVQITEESRPLSSRKQRAGTAFGGFFHSAGNGIVRLCRFLAWLLWNFALALCALPFWARPCRIAFIRRADGLAGPGASTDRRGAGVCGNHCLLRWSSGPWQRSDLAPAQTCLSTGRHRPAPGAVYHAGGIGEGGEPR